MSSAARAVDDAPTRSSSGTALKEHKLLIQRCAGCGRAAPSAAADVPALPLARRGTPSKSSGRGDGLQLRDAAPPAVAVVRRPYIVALVELEEGTRLVTNLCGVEPDDVSIGMPVVVRFEEFDDGLVLPHVRAGGAIDDGARPTRRLAHAAGRRRAPRDGDRRDADRWSSPGAIASRDFMPVHHDRDYANRRARPTSS